MHFFSFELNFSLTSHSDILGYFLKESRFPEKSCIHLVRHTEHRDLKTSICCFLTDIQYIFLPFVGEELCSLMSTYSLPPREVHLLHEDAAALRQVPSELHPATRDNPSSILASKPHRTASPFQCDILANNNQLVFWRNHQMRRFFCLALNGTKYLQPSSVTKDTKKGGGK